MNLPYNVPEEIDDLRLETGLDKISVENLDEMTKKEARGCKVIKKF